MINELDCVVLTHDIPEHGLVQGDVGAVVHVHNSGKAFEVEFVTASGQTIALLTLTPQDVRPRKDREVLHVRELAQQIPA
jgi:hypothetical protein